MNLGRFLLIRFSLAQAIIFLSVVFLIGRVEAVEIIQWKNTPIKLTLTVDQERVIDFGRHVKIGVPETLTETIFRTQSVAGTALWTAYKPFESQRIQVQFLDTGHTLLFDVNAVEKGGSNEPVQIVTAYPQAIPEPVSPPASLTLNSAPTNNEKITPELNSLPEENSTAAITPRELTQFAAQQLYSPKRLLRDDPRITRSPMRLPNALAQLFVGLSAAKFASYPMLQWQSSPWYLTAIRIVNRTQREQSLLNDHLVQQDINADYAYASFQHAQLSPANTPGDTTTLYLITERPINEALDLSVINPPALNSESKSESKSARLSQDGGHL